MSDPDPAVVLAVTLGYLLVVLIGALFAAGWGVWRLALT